MAVLSATENALLSDTDRSYRTRTVASWLPFVFAAASLHAAALFLTLDVVHGSGADEFSFEGPLTVSVALPKPEILEEEPPAAVPAAVRVPVEFSATLGAETLVLTQPEVETRITPEQKTTRLARFTADIADDVPGIPDGAATGARGGPLPDGTDSPLAAGPVGAGLGTGEGSSSGSGAGLNSGSGGIGEPGGKGGGAGGDGRGKKGGGSPLDRAVNALRAPAPALKLPGKPYYPRACREGSCRSGLPCQGSSEWKVWVAGEGGKPTRVEAVKKMECELQNASIRKYFADTKFPPTGTDCVYQFPVRMMMEE